MLLLPDFKKLKTVMDNRKAPEKASSSFKCLGFLGFKTSTRIYPRITAIIGATKFIILLKNQY